MADDAECHANGVATGKSEKDDVQVGANDPAWQWPCFEKWYSSQEGEWKVREVTRTRAAASPADGSTCPFEVLSLINEEEDVPVVSVKLKSPHLIALVRACLPRKVAALCEEPSIEAKDLFVARERLAQEAATRAALDGAEAQLHCGHLLRYVRDDFKDTLTKYEWMRGEGLVSYDMLWAFLHSGVEARRICKISDQPCHGLVVKSKFHDHYDGKFFKVKLEVMDYNVQSYRACTVDYKIAEFDGEVPFFSLAVCPLSVLPEEERAHMESAWLKAGELFYSIAMAEPFRFMHFEGALNFYERGSNGCWQVRRRYAEGRVVVDLLSTAKINPDWPLENARPPVELLRGLVTSLQRKEEGKETRKPAPEELRRGPGLVYGFSLSLKQWGCFEVGGLRDIAFDDNAYERLVMKNQKQKQMLKGLVSTYLSEEEASRKRKVDVIPKKGEGCIVLCYGPPGTGKTLTAETLAEGLHRPLWAISAFELGEEAGKLESSLRAVLSTALRWRAVVLLDEADGYLERRSSNGDIQHNLMTGVFLRLLEYYAGVLFLTTNRVRAFDDAFLSRISVCIRYPELDDEQRLLIWRALLARVGLPDEPAPSTLLAHGHPLNGREIRNVVALAQTWAHSRNVSVSLQDVFDTVQLVVAGCKELLESPLSF